MALIDPDGGTMQAVIRRTTRERLNGDARSGTELVIFVSDNDLERSTLDEIYRIARRLTEQHLLLRRSELAQQQSVPLRRGAPTESAYVTVSCEAGRHHECPLRSCACRCHRERDSSMRVIREVIE